MKDYSDIFNEVGKVEISPFVWTRIQQKIENRSISKNMARTYRAVVVSLVLLVLLNVMALNRTQHQDGSISSFAHSMNLFPQNSIYGE